jgi:hypothetical protein
MSNVLKSTIGKSAIIAATIVSLVATPAIVYADASAPMVRKAAKHHVARAKPKMRKRAVARSTPVTRPAPQVVEAPVTQPTYVPDVPAQVAMPAAPAPTPAPPSAPVSTPVMAAKGSSALLPILGLALVGAGIAAAASGGKAKSL